MRDKAQLRTHFKQKRLALSAQDVATKSQIITQQFITALLPLIKSDYKQKTFSIYSPIFHEVDTQYLITYFKEHGISFCYPKIITKDAALTFVPPTDDESFMNSNIHREVLEPISNQEVTPDYIIMPLLAFDEKLNRLGMGGGFFDRTIANLKEKNNVTTIALAYDFQRSDNLLPTLKTDQILDFIVTESGVIVSS